MERAAWVWTRSGLQLSRCSDRAGARGWEEGLPSEEGLHRSSGDRGCPRDWVMGRGTGQVRQGPVFGEEAGQGWGRTNSRLQDLESQAKGVWDPWAEESGARRGAGLKGGGGTGRT